MINKQLRETVQTLYYNDVSPRVNNSASEIKIVNERKQHLQKPRSEQIIQKALKSTQSELKKFILNNNAMRSSSNDLLNKQKLENSNYQNNFMANKRKYINLRKFKNGSQPHEHTDNEYIASIKEMNELDEAIDRSLNPRDASQSYKHSQIRLNRHLNIQENLLHSANSSMSSFNLEKPQLSNQYQNQETSIVTLKPYKSASGSNPSNSSYRSSKMINRIHLEPITTELAKI